MTEKAHIAAKCQLYPSYTAEQLFCQTWRFVFFQDSALRNLVLRSRWVFALPHAIVAMACPFALLLRCGQIYICRPNAGKGGFRLSPSVRKLNNLRGWNCCLCVAGLTFLSVTAFENTVNFAGLIHHLLGNGHMAVFLVKTNWTKRSKSSPFQIWLWLEGSTEQTARKDGFKPLKNLCTLAAPDSYPYILHSMGNRNPSGTLSTGAETRYSNPAVNVLKLSTRCVGSRYMP